MSIEKVIVDIDIGKGKMVSYCITNTAVSKLNANFKVITSVSQKLAATYSTAIDGILPCVLGKNGKIYAVFRDKSVKEVGKITAQ